MCGQKSAGRARLSERSEVRSDGDATGIWVLHCCQCWLLAAPCDCCRRLLVRISTADSLFSWGAPSTYIHWFLCAPTCHALRTPIYILPVPLVVGHEDSSCSASAFRPLERDQCCQMVAPRPSGGAVHKAIPSYRTQLSPESADSCGKTCVPAASSAATTVKRTVACKSCLPALMSAGAYARRRQLACLSEPMPDLA